MISIDYHDDLNEVKADPQLAALLAAPIALSPFDRLEWWRGLAEECGMHPYIAVARDGDRRAALALVFAKRRLESLASWYCFRVRPAISPGNDDDDLLEAMARDLTGEAPHIVLAPLPDENGEATRLAAAFRRAGWTVFRRRCGINHVLRVQGRSFEQFLAGRPGELKTTLERKAAKVSVTIETSFNPESWRAYEVIYANSWKPTEGSPAFLRRFAEEEGAAGRLRLGIARAGDEPVAAQFWTVEAETAFIHKLAHAETSKKLSPGTTLGAALFAHVIDRDKVNLIDFGTGDDAYKRNWMEEVRPRYRLEMFRPGWPGNWHAIVRELLRNLAGRANHA